MKVGMLWLDDDSNREIQARLERAADYYRDKYGSTPNVCYIHPRTAGEGMPATVGQMEVATDELVLPGHFWLGVLEPVQEVQPAGAVASGEGADR